MALGGGIFTAQNKKLPGSYINFVSASRANSNLSERGYVAIPLELDWGVEGSVITLTHEDFTENSLKLFGYSYTHEKLRPLRELFLNARILYIYRLGTGSKAASTIATAKYAGTRGNSIKVITTAILDNESIIGYKVITQIGDITVDSQEVSGSSSKTNDLAANDYVDWIADISLSAGTITLTGGANATITSDNYETFLAKIEPYSFNIIAYPGTETTIKELFTAFTKRLRDDLGIKFQCVLHKYNTADYEGVISVENNLTSGTNSDIVYWVAGASAGCEINKSNTNKIYNGEYSIDINYTQAQLETAIDDGKFIFHKVGDDVRVLEDINTLTTITESKGEDFKANQTIRVIDQIGNDIAALFNTKYLGIIPNDESGRISLWNDIVKHHQELEQIRAIENFISSNVSVEQGDTRRSVLVYDIIAPTNCMEQLYMICQIS